MRPQRWRTLGAATAAVAALTITACSAPDESGSDSDSASVPTAEAGAYPVTIDHVFGKTTIDSQRKRVAAMGVGDADNLLALGVKPVTIATFADPDATSSPWNADLIGDTSPTVLPNTSSEFGGQIAKALSTNPDLITAVGAVPTREQYDTLAKTTPTILRPTGATAWETPWDVQVTEIGKAVGLPKAAEAKVAETKKYLTDVQNQHPQFAGKTGVVVTGAPNGGVSIYSEGDGRGQTLTGYGLKFPEQLRSAITNGFYGELAAESLNRLDSADVVVAVDWAGSNDKLRADPAFQRTAAAREGRVVYLDQEVGSAMSVPTVLTIPWVGSRAVGPIADAIK
ncbi:ABC transporter substrate-binding protein [Gordonia soli]|uniref:Putative iron-siderophore ABC transporter substrate-binding protein n=1 Tax=Gordonia soli NBRC 108243 TaxID=1223545 RepID=M0QIL6_9ACTN|nr:ABC transporter substrate-binding protein [Gordonia soli]GAC68146.1 putative iron-siderophore ABC transporter substrate-binding protein [Gordonia soli NBRC 108243]